MLAGALNAVGAACGCLLAAAVFFGFAHMLDIRQDYVVPSFLFCCAQLWALVSAPTGMVRALNQFRMAVYVEAVVPVGRLVGALAVWLTAPGVERFLFVWALVDLIEAGLYWAMARRLCPEAVRLTYLKGYRHALRENSGLWRFFMVTYVGATLDALTKNGPLLIVGGVVGTRAAGLYRLASQLSQALSKFSTMLTRAVYAEVSRARVASSAREFRHLATQTSLIAGAGGIVVVVVALAFGQSLLGLIGGEAFEGGVAILVPLALAASFDLASVAFEPVLHSLGQAQLSLTADCRAGGAGLGHGAVHPPWPERRGLGRCAGSGRALHRHGSYCVDNPGPNRASRFSPGGDCTSRLGASGSGAGQHERNSGAAHGVAATATRDPTSD